MLHHLIDGQHQRVPVGSRIELLIGGRQCLPQRIFRRDLPPRRSGQHGVILGLDAVNALIVVIRKTDNAGSQVIVGVEPLGVHLQIDPGQPVVGDVIGDLVCDGLDHLPLHFPVHTFRVGKVSPDRFLVYLQNVAKPVYELLLIGVLFRLGLQP